MLDQTYFASYADGKTTCTVNEILEEVIRTLEDIAKPRLKWFKDNKLKLNPDKCFLLLSGKEDGSINVGSVFVTNSDNNKVTSSIFW